MVAAGEEIAPRCTRVDRTLFVSLPVQGHVVGERIVGVGSAHEGLDGEEDGAHLQGRTPLVLEDVQADAAEFVNVGVVDPCEEAHLWRHHRIVLWEEEL